MDKVKWTGRERDALMFVCALEHNLNTEPAATLEKRIRSAGKTCWRDWRLAARLVNKVLNQVLDTLPINNYAQLDAQLRGMELRFIPSRSASTPVDYIMVRQDHLRALGLHATKNECGMCMKSPAEAKDCELHKVLAWVAPLPFDPPGELATCEYAHVVHEEE